MSASRPVRRRRARLQGLCILPQPAFEAESRCRNLYRAWCTSRCPLTTRPRACRSSTPSSTARLSSARSSAPERPQRRLRPAPRRPHRGVRRRAQDRRGQPIHQRRPGRQCPGLRRLRVLIARVSEPPGIAALQSHAPGPHPTDKLRGSSQRPGTVPGDRTSDLQLPGGGGMNLRPLGYEDRGARFNPDRQGLARASA